MWFSLIRKASWQAHAVIAAAAHPHRVLLRPAQSGDGLAGVEHGDPGAGGEVAVAARRGGGAGQRLQQVERGALAGEQGAGVALQFAQHLVGAQVVALGGQPAAAAAGVEAREHQLGPGAAAQHAGLAGDDAGAGAGAGGDQLCGDVAAAEVLGEGLVDQALAVGLQFGVGLPVAIEGHGGQHAASVRPL